MSGMDEPEQLKLEGAQPKQPQSPEAAKQESQAQPDAAKPEQAAQQEMRQKPKKARPKRKAFRLTKFDKFLLETVRRGESDSEALRARFNLDPLQFDGRVRELASKGYLVPDAANPRVLRLGLAAFEKLQPKLQPEKSTGQQENQQQLQQAQQQQAKEAQQKEEAQKQQPQQMPTAIPASVPAAQPHLEPDLADLLSKGKPNPGYTKTFLTISKVGRKWLEEQGQKKPVKETLILEVPSQKGRDGRAAEQRQASSEEKCELCRAAFTLSVGKDSNPKYGHCFCGAPYHKDCYDSILEGSGGKCVRCGKQLSLFLDRGSEEAIKELRKLFD